MTPVRSACLIATVASIALAALPCRAAPLRFQLRYTPEVAKAPFSGRVYVMLSKSKITQLPSGPRWFNPEPFFAQDVSDWKAGEVRSISAASLGFPHRLDQLPAGKYWAVAVMDFDRGERSFSAAAGNAYSEPVALDLDPQKSGDVSLTIRKIYQPPAFKETERVKLVEIESRLLSQFHRRPVLLRAGVVLPKSYGQRPERRYPVVYVIPGFGGNHFGAFGIAARNGTDVAGIEMIQVVLDPNCRWGHHVFADSENNGPCGQALCQELVPFIEKKFRALGQPTARFVTGHSSGGWSSLWLQITYPDFFGGVWSTAPDPVDFRDFQRVNIYAPKANLFFDEKGASRPLGRRGDKVLIWYKPFSDMEVVMGHGGQLGSFEAVFSPRGPDGRPRQLWDRRTGAIDPEVARSWQRYDIRLILEKNWATLGPQLAGKIHVYMGEQDNYYLEGATMLLRDSFKKLGSDAVVELFPGKDHGTLLSGSLRERIAREMAAQFLKHHPKQAREVLPPRPTQHLASAVSRSPGCAASNRDRKPCLCGAVQ